jgi:hypothetical protein
MLMKPQWPALDDAVWPLVLAISKLPEGALMKRSKDDARKEWAKLGKTGEISCDALLGCLERCRAEYSRPLKKDINGRVIEFREMLPHFCRWLSHKRWEDYEAQLETPSGFVLRKVMIKRDSPQAVAWEIFRGRIIPWGPSGLWAVDSEWPPGQEQL